VSHAPAGRLRRRAGRWRGCGLPRNLPTRCPLHSLKPRPPAPHAAPSQAKRNVESGKIFRANEALAAARMAEQRKECELREVQVRRAWPGLDWTGLDGLFYLYWALWPRGVGGPGTDCRQRCSLWAVRLVQLPFRVPWGPPHFQGSLPPTSDRIAMPVAPAAPANPLLPPPATLQASLEAHRREVARQAAAREAAEREAQELRVRGAPGTGGGRSPMSRARSAAGRRTNDGAQAGKLRGGEYARASSSLHNLLLPPLSLRQHEGPA
jgi:hypothetical protein